MKQHILTIAYPLIIANLSTPLLGMVDTAILGHLPNSSALAAAALGASVLAFFYWGFGFLRMSTTGACAQALGQGRISESDQLLRDALLLAIGISICVALAGPWLLPAIIGFSQEQQGLAELAGQYTQIRLFSAPAVLVSYVILGWLLAQKDSRSSLHLLFIVNGANILLDYLFIIHWQYGLKGAAWASVCAEYLGLTFALLKLARYHPRFYSPFTHKLNVRDLLIQNSNLFVRTVILLSVLASFNFLSARLSTDILAANAILMQLILLASFANDGIAQAMEALAGESAGAKNRQRFRALIHAAWILSASITLLISLISLYFEAGISTLFTDNNDILAILSQYWPYCIATMIVAFPAYLLDGVFIGLKQGQLMRNSMGLSAVVFCLTLSVLGLDNPSLWLAFIVFSALRSSSLIAYYRYKHLDQFS